MSLLIADKANVYTPLLDPVGKFTLDSFYYFKMNIRMLMLEFPDDLRDPVNRTAQIGSYFNSTNLCAFQRSDFLIDHFICIEQCTNGRNQWFGICGQSHSVIVFDKQRKSDFFFQGFHHLCNARLCIPQFFACACETSVVIHCKHNFPSFYIHIVIPHFCIKKRYASIYISNTKTKGWGIQGQWGKNIGKTWYVKEKVAEIEDVYI